MPFNHCLKILFDPSSAVIAVDNVAENAEIGVGPFSYLLNNSVHIACTFHAIVLGLQGGNYPICGSQHRPCGKAQVGWGGSPPELCGIGP